MKFILNGSEHEYLGDLSLSLLDYLRIHQEITSVKDGCSPEGACGACTVEVNGKSTLSCSTPMSKLEGASIFTIEGLDEYRKNIFANAFVEKSGVQCGFCIPGIVMQAKVLIDKNPNPTRKEVELAIHSNLCRCTGYKKIIDSIIYAAEAIREIKDIPTPKLDPKVGGRQPKYDAKKLVLGEFPYVSDYKISGMHFGALKFSDHPRAIIKSININKAVNSNGVIKVITGKDIPGNRFTGLIVKDWPLMINEDETTRYIGDVLALIVADTESNAREAVSQIEVDYEVLEPITTPESALIADAPKIHPNGNLLSETIIDRGDFTDAYKNTKFVSEGCYETQTIEHAFMEPECAIAKPGHDGIELLSQGQGIYEDQKQTASLLNLPIDKIRVVLVPNGGGFGGKEDMTVQGHAALASYITQKPVKVLLSREESIRMHPKRHPLKMKYKLGCSDKGKLTYLEADIIGDTGAYASVGMKVLERAAGHASGAYSILNLKLISRAVYTNNIPNGAMRGFGVNQVTFALENCIDDLCNKGNFDKWQFRFDNALDKGGVTATGQIVNKGVGVKETLLAVKDQYQKAKFAGIACGIKNTGIGNGMPDEGITKIEILSENKIVLNHGWTEMGQGVNTMALQFFCQETLIDPKFIEVKTDTKSKAKSGMTTASRATSIVGNSIKEAVKPLIKDLKTKSLAELVGKTYTGQWICDWTTKPENKSEKIITHYSYSYATQVVLLDDDGNIDKIIAAHDAGRIINPNLFEGQIEGSIHMGLGYAISEDLEYEDGFPKSFKLRKCGVLRARQTPNIEVIGVEVKDPHGPYGAKGVGEIGLVPTAAAVANAFTSFDKNRYYKLPIKKRIQDH